MEKQDKEHLDKINAYMLETYGITIQDTGYPPEEWLARFGDKPVMQAVDDYGDKYHLTRLDTAKNTNLHG